MLYFWDFQKCVREGKNGKWVPESNLFIFRKKLPPYSRTISDEKHDVVQKTAHNWFAKTLYFDRFGDYQIQLTSPISDS